MGSLLFVCKYFDIAEIIIQTLRVAFNAIYIQILKRIKDICAFKVTKIFLKHTIDKRIFLGNITSMNYFLWY